MGFLPGLATVVDANGNLLASTVGQAPPTTHVVGAATSQVAAALVSGLAPSGKLAALATDAGGNLLTRSAASVTASVSTPAAVSANTAGKSMLSVFNGSTTNTVRIHAVWALCPPQMNTSGGLLGIGSGTTYTSIFFSARRISAHTGGTLLTPVAHDPGDDALLDTAVSVRTGATVTTSTAAATLVWDAAYNGSAPIGQPVDAAMKAWTLPPGTGMTITSIAAVNANFLMAAALTQSAV
jgi:hypothetical protein